MYVKDGQLIKQMIYKLLILMVLVMKVGKMFGEFGTKLLQGKTIFGGAKKIPQKIEEKKYFNYFRKIIKKNS